MNSYVTGVPLTFSELTEKLSAELGVFHNGALNSSGQLEEAGFSCDQTIDSIASADTALAGSCVCISDRKHFEDALSSKSRVFIISENLKPYIEKQVSEKHSSKSFMVLWVKDAYNALANLTQYFFSPDCPFPWPSAFESTLLISENAEIGEGTEIAPAVSIADGVNIGKNCQIHPGVVISSGVEIGNETVLFPNVVLYPGVSIGHRVRIHSGVVIGSDGFGYARQDNLPNKLHHIGGVKIGNDVEIGSNSAVDRGTFGDTVIGNFVKIDNLCQIGHNARIGDGSVICGQSGVSGSAKVGKSNTLGGMTGLGNIETGLGVMFAGGSQVTTSKIPDGAVIAGRPDRPYKEWMKINAYLSRLPEIFKRVKKLETK